MKEKYGFLTIIGEAGFKLFPSGQKRRLIKSICDCGKIHITYLQKIQNGETKSCGCYRKNKKPTNRKELINGQYIGPFIYLKDTEYRNRKRRVLIRCFCGKEKETTLYTAEHSKSCGCLEKSKKAKHIADRVRLNSLNRRAKKKTVDDKTINQKVIDELLYLQFNSCIICGCNIVAKYHIDHIKPLNKLGEHSRYNIQLLCPDCNRTKSDGYNW